MILCCFYGLTRAANNSTQSKVYMVKGKDKKGIREVLIEHKRVKYFREVQGNSWKDMPIQRSNEKEKKHGSYLGLE